MPTSPFSNFILPLLPCCLQPTPIAHSKFSVKITPFKFLIVTEKHFWSQTFFVVKYFRNYLIFFLNCNPTLPEKSHPLFPSKPPLRIDVLSSLPERGQGAVAQYKFTEVWHDLISHITQRHTDTDSDTQTHKHTNTITHTHTHTHTQINTAHSDCRLTHPYKYIFTPTVMCS